ncbi:DUF2756 family protein [Enterobacteriaceae bacterium G50]|nr:DUF2756 family protein [Enterobacteriaceae bacterium G50]
MKRLLILAALLPFAAVAQPLNPTNNPNLPDYKIPSQQRLQTQMKSQQVQQKGMLNQQLQTQTRVQQQQLQTQMNNDRQRIQQAQPGERIPAGQQMLPNTNGGMLNQSGASGNSDSMLNNQQHMLPQRQNGDMLNNNPNLPVKTNLP